MPKPLPLDDLLACLRDQGLPVGVREHLVVGRLLARWDDTDVSSLRGALGAVLARNPDEVRIVHETFDQLYGAPPAEPEQTPVPQEVRPRQRRILWGWIAGMIATALVLALIAGALLWPRKLPDPVSVPPTAQSVPDTAPPPPEIFKTIQTPDWRRSFTAATGLAAGLFVWLFGVRLRRGARQRARRRLVEEADTLPGPHRYDFSLADLRPPFFRELLDDAAGLLGRRTSVPPRHGDLDVERTLARTLRAGLAPHIVLHSRASTHPLLVLEDVGDEMRPWRRRVSALLSGLETRGVPLDRWRFHADAGRVFRDPGAPPLTLKQLFRLRAESPLLVVSAGEGLLEGFEGRPAPWVEALQGWRYGAWLHPVTDPAWWRPALHQVPIHAWPMTPEGVMAAARQLVHGEAGRPVRESLPQRRVSPLDVERLRWLLALAPRRDPDLGELLRQQFFPQVPPAALLAALDAPPSVAPLGIGPSAEEVHAFLAELLASSEPEPETAAHERWRLDRALQEIRIPGREEAAAQKLIDLAQGPLAGEVVASVERLAARRPGPETPIPASGARYLKRKVLRPVLVQAGRPGEGRGWRPTWPDLTEIAAALVCLGLLGFLFPSLSRGFQREVPVTLEKVYQLYVGFQMTPRVEGVIAEMIDESAPDTAELYQDGQLFEIVDVGISPRAIEVPAGHWYDLRAPAGEGRLAISEAPVWVPETLPTLPPASTPQLSYVPAPGEDKPTKMPSGGTAGTPDAPAGQADPAEFEKRRQELLGRLDAIDEELKISRSVSLVSYKLEALRGRLQMAKPDELGGIAQDVEEFLKIARNTLPEPSGVQEQEQPAATLQSIKPDRGHSGQDLDIYLIGANFTSKTRVLFREASRTVYPPLDRLPIEVLSCEAPTSTELKCAIRISPYTSPGPYEVAVINPDATRYEYYQNLFTVEAPAAGN